MNSGIIPDFNNVTENFNLDSTCIFTFSPIDGSCLHLL